MIGGQRDNEKHNRKTAKKNRIIMLMLMVLLFSSFLISMNTGYTRIAPVDTIRILLGGGADKENLVLFQFRLPRIVISVLVGAGLALSGCIIQGVARNALADPGLLGINAGAGLMAILFVLFFAPRSFMTVFTLPFVALLGAGIAAITVYLLSHKKGVGTDSISGTFGCIASGIRYRSGCAKKILCFMFMEKEK
jgi:iron complex transport system permease protein